MNEAWRKEGVPAIRHVLQQAKLSNSEHAGLMLQRYLQRHKPQERESQQQMPEEALLEAVQEFSAPAAYCTAFQRWYAFAKSRLRCFTMALATPLAIGLGNASPLEVGLTLHHTYGMPIIPGSALKGLCRRGARLFERNRQIKHSAWKELLFGIAGEQASAAGCVVFYDAWYDPDSVKGKPFHRDVMTVHHPAYYGSGRTPPTDFDDPRPVPFVVIKPGARFVFALDAATDRWAAFAEQLLRWCLMNLGVGAKTNAGYGYFR